MKQVIIAGISTSVGKTVVSGILIQALHGDYWKPIQCGYPRDLDTVKALVTSSSSVFHSETYLLDRPVSPHFAASQQKITIVEEKICPPMTFKPLIIETAGGVLTPLNHSRTNLDLFASWNAVWILVCRNYLGCINHTLLTLEAMKGRGCDVRGIVFNGTPSPHIEEAILSRHPLPFSERLLPCHNFDHHVTKRYAEKWTYSLQRLF